MPPALQNKSLRKRTSLKCNNLLVFKYLDTSLPYLHFFVSRKYGNAIKRNLFKRRARVLYSNLAKKLNPVMLGISVYPMKQNISYIELKNCFKILEKKVL